MYTLIKNGTVYDGSGAKPVTADLLIEDDKIAKIAEKIEAPGAQTLDASGMAVTPGFVDTHRHCDLAALTDESFGELELAQGLTTVLGGNCGLSPVPSAPASRKDQYDFIEPCLGAASASMAFEHYSEYFAHLKKTGLHLNMGMLAATGAIKTAVKGYTKTPFTPAEMTAAQAHVQEAMESGVFGLSMGIMYNPECYSTREEITEFVHAAAPYNRFMSCHIRGEGNNLLYSVEEIMDIGAKAGVPVNISHFKSTGLINWNDKIHRAIELVEKARSAGQDVTVDFYPYTGGSTTLMTLIPPVVLEDTIEETLKKLARPDGKKQLAEAIYKEHEGWDNMVTAIGWERIVISSVNKKENSGFSGRNLAELASAQGYAEPSDFICDLLADEEGKVGIIVLSMSQEDVDTVARLPYSMIISDSLYGKADNPHPRLYGSFPKIIREYVLERGVLTMEQAIHKMTGLPAQRIKLDKRGLLKAGNYADIAIFRPEALQDRAVYEKSKQLSTGMSWVFINGMPALQDGKMTKEKHASVLKPF